MRALVSNRYPVYTGVVKLLGILVVNLVILLVLLAALEIVLGGLAGKDPLPFDGYKQSVRYTWGHRVKSNSLGFREREIQHPKPAGAYRVMVLGDSLTWGAGVAEAERYTNVTERLLSERFPDRTIEVLNFGINGLPTIGQLKVLLEHHAVAEPDLIVVGFCFNDPQPRSQDYSVERERLNLSARPLLDQLWALQQWAPHLAQQLESLFWRTAEAGGVIPHWWEALDRVYRKDSVEWLAFSAALKAIHETSTALELPQPVFMILNQGSSTREPTYYSQPDELLTLYLQWYHQAEEQARTSGFRTFNHQAEFARELDGEVLGVNRVDGHPSAREHRIYADKLSALITADLEQPPAPTQTP